MESENAPVPLSRFAAGTVLFAALVGFGAVAVGAWAAHGAEGPAQALGETAARYAMWHALAMVGTALARERLTARIPRALAAIAAVLFFSGIVLFSGGLMASALGTPLGTAPAGGYAFMAGWAALAAAALGALFSLGRQS
jgi:uncharacterized membrane protein YgdD (TMEM256/DUF423 family)